jgi:hypothetical protein
MTPRTFLPKASYMPWNGEYRPTYRWYQESPWTLVPGNRRYPTAAQAIAAADEFLAKGLNPPIRAETAEPCDILGLSAWHLEKAAQRAAEQEQALGAIVVKSRMVIVERRRVKA